jgi:nucleoside-diphosphate-sugar epimerase
MKQKVLVTGHTGFIGSALMAALRCDERYRPMGFSGAQGDLCDARRLRRWPRVDLIVHLAGTVGVPQGWEHPLEMYRNNTMPTLNVLEMARRQKARVVYVSSYVYGEPRYLPVDESHPVQCESPYARSKRMAEWLCEAYARDFQVPVTILRPFNLYGPGQSVRHLIPQVLSQALRGREIRVKDLRPRRDFLHIDDFTSALLKVLADPPDGCDVYNVGYGRSDSVQDVIGIVLRLLKKRVPVVSTGETRTREIMDCYCSHDKITRRFGWEPEISLDRGLAGMLKHLQPKKRERP